MFDKDALTRRLEKWFADVGYTPDMNIYKVNMHMVISEIVRLASQYNIDLEYAQPIDIIDDISNDLECQDWRAVVRDAVRRYFEIPADPTIERVRYVRDLLRTSTPPEAYNMTEEEWKMHKIEKAAHHLSMIIIDYEEK